VYHRTGLASWPIRKKLLLLLLVIFMPAFGIIVVSGFAQRRNEIREADRNALLLAQSLAAQQEQIAIGTKQMLSTLAQLPEVQGLDAWACNKLFRDLQIRHPFYSIISAVTPDGNMFAASIPFVPGTVNLSDRKHVEEAEETLDFSAGEFSVGRVSKVQSLNYAYPVLGADKVLIALITAGFRLEEFARFINDANLPEGSSVTIADHRGVRLFRFPENEATAPGKPIPEDAFKRVSAELDQGTFEKVSEDGTLRVYAFKQLRLRRHSPPYLFMIVGIPRDKILHEANMEMLRNLLFLGIAASAATCLAWIFGSFVFVRPINRLLSATQRFGKGELGTRTGLPHTLDELGRLASSFDDMASLLEMRNIERKHVEEELRESEEKYRRLFETLIDVYYRVDLSGEIIMVSPSVAMTSGFRPDELIGKNVRDFYSHPQERDRFLRHITETGLAENFELQMKRKDGSVLWLSVNARVIMDNMGNLLGIEGIARDINDRKRAEEALRKGYAFRNTIIENITEGLCVCHETADCPFLKFTIWNDRMTEITGYTLEEINGADWSQALCPNPESRAGAIARAQRMRRGENLRAEEWEITRADGSIRLLRISTSMVESDDGLDHYLALMQDVTEQKRAEEELLKVKKLEAIGILAGGIAHDFNNLLGIVLGSIDMARLELGHGTRAHKLFDNAEKALLRAKHLTSEFLTFSKGGAPIKANVLLETLIRNSVDLALSGSNVECEYSFADGLWQVVVDPGLISQVFTNITINAKESMPSGGVIEICAKNITADAKAQQTDTPIKDGRYVSISIRDYGMGIPKENIDKIFDPYFSTKQRGSQKGMGLGLAVAHSIVRGHDGYIFAESDVGIGTTFHVLLPASPGMTG
jgi:two-component system, cell cycle sensor histidine kinase and response regulator CckA